MNQDMKVKVFWNKCCVIGWVVTDILNDHSAITFRVKQSPWTIWFWKWRHYDSLKHWKLPTQQHSVTSHKISLLQKSQIPTEDCAGSFAHLTHEEYELLDKPWHKHVDINPDLLEHSLQRKFWKMYFCTKRRLLLPHINKWTVCKEIFIMACS